MFKQRALSAGFSLIELTIVLVVVGLMLQASVSPLGHRIEHKRRLSASDQLALVHQHLKAYWVTHARLPCPVHQTRPSGISLGENNECGQATGGLPANLLGIVGPVNSAGALLDPWSKPLMYSVSLSDIDAAENPNSPDWLTPDTLSTLNFTNLVADLSVCRDALAGTCSRTSEAAADIVAVVVSSGLNETDREQDNRDGDQRFISAPYSTAEEYAFDDQLIWLGRSELIYLALQVGWLP